MLSITINRIVKCAERKFKVQTFIISLFFILFLVIVIRGSLLGGTSIDISSHYKLFSTAQNVVRNFPNKVDVTYATDPLGTGAYDDKGNTYFFITHIFNSLLGNEVFLQSVSENHDAVVVRHLVMIVIGILGALTCAYLTWATSRSTTFALTSAVLLFSIPIWTSSLYINPRDPVVAVGYSMLTAGLSTAKMSFTEFYYLRRMPNFLVGSGLTLAVGTRLSMWLICAITILFSLFPPLARRQWQGALMQGLRLAAPCSVGVFLVLVTNPQTWYNPVIYAIEVVRSSSNFTLWGGQTLVMGKIYPGQQPPWFYFPIWILAQTPLLVVALFLASAVVLIRKSRSLPIETVLLLVLQVTLVPVLLTVNNSVVYNGSRAVMFVFPAMVVLACLGLHSSVGHRMKSKLPIVAVWLLAVLPLAENYLLFPYGYTYVNPAARLLGTEKHWEMDFFGLSRWDSKVTGDTSQLAIWPASETLPAPRRSYRWFDPNIMPSPIGCSREYISRRLLFREIRFGYLSTCPAESQRHPMFTLAGCLPYSKIECVSYRTQTRSDSATTVSLVSPILGLSTYHVNVCVDLLITLRSQGNHLSDAPEFTLFLDQTGRPIHASSSSLLPSTAIPVDHQSPNETKGHLVGSVCFEVPDRMAWDSPEEFTLRYSNRQSTFSWSFYFSQRHSS